MAPNKCTTCLMYNAILALSNDHRNTVITISWPLISLAYTELRK